MRYEFLSWTAIIDNLSCPNNLRVVVAYQRKGHKKSQYENFHIDFFVYQNKRILSYASAGASSVSVAGASSEVS